MAQEPTGLLSNHIVWHWQKEMSALALYRTEAVVIRTRNLGEADKILTLFTKKEGKVNAVARGSRRTRSRFLGISQPLTHSRLLIFRGENLDSVSQGEILHAWLHLREDLLKMAYATYIVELLDQLTEERDPQEEVYRLLVNTLQHLNIEDSQEGNITRFFELHLLRLTGFQPQLDLCVRCGRFIDGGGAGLRFSPVDGGVLCPDCGEKQSGSLKLSSTSHQVMRHLLSTDLQRLSVLKISHTCQQEIEKLVQAFINYQLGRPLKSREFLETVRGIS